MKRITKKTLLTAALASVFSMPVGASTLALTADSQWYSFDVDSSYATSGGLEWIDAQFNTGYNSDGSALNFTFTLTDSADLNVVDGGFAGDQFQVFDNGIALGFTSVPTTNTYPASVASNFDAAWADIQYSRAVFHLGAGSHKITGLLSISALDNTAIPLNATVGALSLTPTAVPLPGAMVLFLAGSGLMGFISRRRTN
jgi:hypothetical protein